MLPRLFNYLYEKMLSRLGLALLALALVVNLGALLAVDHGIALLDKARAGAEHSRDVMTEMLSVQSILYRDESAQRGFLYTQRAEYLAPLNENDGRIISQLAKLGDMVDDSPGQKKLVNQVLTLATLRIDLQNKTVALQQMGEKAAALALVNSDQGKALMEEIDLNVSRFLVHEEQRRQERTQRSADIQLAIRWGFAIILFINALMILAGAVSIMRSMAREISRDRADLMQQDEREAVSASEMVERAAELRALSAHLIGLQEEERRVVARDLHDELGGTLSAVKMDILMGRDAAAKRSDEKSVARLQRALASIDTGIQFIRRLIEDLRPTLLDNLGLEAALQSMVDQFCERAGVLCEVSLPEGELNLSSAQSTALYRICQESLTNVLKYAQAKRVTINLTSDGTRWTLRVTDDGVGLEASRKDRSKSHGLIGMRERVLALGGSFDIRGPAGHGTILTATFPVEEGELPPA